MENVVRFVKRLREFRLFSLPQTKEATALFFLSRPPNFISDALAIWDKSARFRYDTKFIETFESSAEDEEEKSWQWSIRMLCSARKNA